MYIMKSAVEVFIAFVIGLGSLMDIGIDHSREGPTSPVSSQGSDPPPEPKVPTSIQYRGPPENVWDAVLDEQEEHLSSTIPEYLFEHSWDAPDERVLV